MLKQNLEFMAHEIFEELLEFWGRGYSAPKPVKSQPYRSHGVYVDVDPTLWMDFRVIRKLSLP